MYNCLGECQKVYVLCPAGAKSGGPELLHQLVSELLQNGVEAYMVYIKSSAEFGINSSFREYIDKFITFDDIEDIENNVVIFPEVYVNFINKIKKAKRCVWWLSVDNYVFRYDFHCVIKRKKVRKLIYFFLYKWRYQVKYIKDKIDVNLAQSYYAIDFLRKNGFYNIEYLSDYLNSSYLGKSFKEVNRENYVLYNPKKGIRFTKLLMKKAPYLQWIPLTNLSNEEVKDLLCRSKVYIDFGNHPGKDRLPREAAICGCCIITGKDGAAGFKEDVCIDDQFKFEAVEDNVNRIIDKINDCLDNYEKNNKYFKEYRDRIRLEPEQFKSDVKRIFLQ